jgi:hypothetical protein
MHLEAAERALARSPCEDGDTYIGERYRVFVQGKASGGTLVLWSIELSRSLRSVQRKIFTKSLALDMAPFPSHPGASGLFDVFSN